MAQPRLCPGCSYGHTPLAGALTFGQPAAANLLKKAGARVVVNAPAAKAVTRNGGGGAAADNTGFTPDMAAAAQAM